MTPAASKRRRMTRRWRYVAAFAAVLVGGGVPSVHADTVPGARCDVRQLETLTLRVGKAPAVVPRGRTLIVPVEVVRAAGTPVELGAEGVTVLVGLAGPDWGVYGDLVSNAQGRTVARFAVPRGVRGAVRLDVEGFRPVINATCLSVEEHGRVVLPWGVVS